MKFTSNTEQDADVEVLDIPASPRDGARILISIPHGFQLRQLVHSGILECLVNAKCQILILSPNKDGEGFAAYLPQRGVKVHYFKLKDGPFKRRYWAARQHFLIDGVPTDTLRQKMQTLRRRYRGVAFIAKVGHRLLQSFPSLRRKVLVWERLIVRDKTVESFLSAEQIDLALLGSPGYTPEDAVILHAVVHRGIPVAAAVLSWDNLSSKGVINPQPDRLFVWSHHMRREAIELHGIRPEKIVETGAPVHDAFANTGRFGSRSENLARLKLDTKRRLIVYGTNHAVDFPDEIEVVKRIAQWIEEDALGIPCQLWVRLHPLAVVGPYYSADTDLYRSIASERVTIEFPPMRKSTLLWDLPKSDLEHLVGLLRDADVVINTGSLSIDAAILDRPVVCIAYDPSGDLPYEKSLRRYYDYTHMSSVIRAGAVQLASSSDDLRQKIVNYLNQPSLDREGRRRIVEQQFGRVDGCSATRIVEAILNMTQSESKPSLVSVAVAD